MLDTGLLIGAGMGIVGVAAIVAVLFLVTQRSTGLVLGPDGESEGELPKGLLGPVERLSFTESLDSEKFAGAAETAAEELLSALWRGAFDGATVTLSSVRLLSSKAEMIVTATRDGRALIQSGLATVPRHMASGQMLPLVTDPKTGKVLELMREAPAAKRVAQLTSLSSVIVGAAHIIASADIAKELKIIDGKLDTLLAYHRIDQAAALERIYTSAKELAHMAPNRTTQSELWRLRTELRQLRSTWRREVQFHLVNIEEPANAGWIERQFNAVASVIIDREGVAQSRIHSKISEGQLQLTLIEYALRLDQILAIGSNSVSAFEHTLADELVEMRVVVDLLETKAGYITKKNRQFSIDPMLSGLRNMIEHYQAILPERIAIEADRPQPSFPLASTATAN